MSVTTIYSGVQAQSRCIAARKRQVCARMAQELDIKENTLYNWKTLYQDKAGAAFTNSVSC